MTNNSIDNPDWRVVRTRIRLYAECMPELSRFLGIVIAMYYRDHAHVQEWRRLHETGEHASAGMPLWRIDPLE